jgi:hypothetical protein
LAPPVNSRSTTSRWCEAATRSAVARIVSICRAMGVFGDSAGWRAGVRREGNATLGGAPVLPGRHSGQTKSGLSPTHLFRHIPGPLTGESTPTCGALRQNGIVCSTECRRWARKFQVGRVRAACAGTRRVARGCGGRPRHRRCRWCGRSCSLPGKLSAELGGRYRCQRAVVRAGRARRRRYRLPCGRGP